MICTGRAITEGVRTGAIRIEPFIPDQVNPNSINVRLGRTLHVYTGSVLDSYKPNPTREVQIPEEGFVLQPHTLYLGHTIERVGSTRHVPLLEGRSSVGRLGLHVHITAPIGDLGFYGQWTLHLTPVQPLRVYAGMQIAQVMFEVASGEVDLYQGKYQGASGPRPSEMWRHAPGHRQVAS
ncbi:dCTP deaminase [Nocardiopsis sp. LDBS1602]|uniref:dCTP deaminase n=1 Tax=Nocardiopsis sp. LDBS1602 TaxID=3109597 RepID=UPI002DB78494|nr:dCTP deaminase [Nocardiopsis sp. LDBS1602]MEC3891826.1 dCTP deaminase [Nocardiopsis sp. LDBS1602]